jgi:hypothetical protein
MSGKTSILALKHFEESQFQLTEKDLSRLTRNRVVFLMRIIYDCFYGFSFLSFIIFIIISGIYVFKANDEFSVSHQKGNFTVSL